MQFRTFIHILAIAVALLLGSACERGASDNPTLLHAAHLLENEPDSIKEAKQILNSLNPASLDEGDRSLHTLLTVKANDKLYIPHTSDSLILTVVKYEEKHPKRGYFTEALYYAGRVYADLGDYPTSLDFFQKALEKIDNSQKNDFSLKGRILSQMGRLYHNLEFYSEASIYLREVIKLNESQQDTVNLSFNNQLLGADLIHAGKLDSASIHIDRAYHLAKDVSPEQYAFMKLYKAILKQKQGRIDSALFLIKDVPEKVWEDVRPLALLTTADMYHTAGIPDSAFKYASLVIHNQDNSYDNYRRGAYNIILSPQTRHLVDKDSLYPLTVKFLEAANDELLKRDASSITQQKNNFNYSLHIRKMLQAQESSKLSLILAVSLFVLILLIIIVFLIFKNRKDKKIIRLMEINKMLQEKIDKYSRKSFPAQRGDTHQSTNTQEQQLIGELETLLSTLEKINKEDKVDDSILVSSVYKDIQKAILDGTPIKENDKTWCELEKTVLDASPDFMKNLYLVTGGVTKEEKRLALLIRCGVRPNQAAIIFCLTKQGLNGRKSRLKKKIEAKHIDVQSLDIFLRML